ncbi:MAG TPA: TonB-dependent hemoglobin/transferrin/lactoferrin family receptor [Ramlibacter sp.]|jgi:hemoglobin/transferrin/lactoferrin receptor protein|uniref:TonB-dependent hemoglobin/transferrin/lactoferrin family receptor n=1 Tax=Ramlibacter sp. TaxID=1917967 RepID=UPI002D5F85CD|nr:TonB-dependent hemoglobin/transferrin/lactoferrin family receptor [Ramlibacter sp.]HZY20739.1 TonB-dependent hemoglobin/transferrin/lactoferrin family receptor [Ramlibacter sp.]
MKKRNDVAGLRLSKLTLCIALAWGAFPVCAQDASVGKPAPEGALKPVVVSGSRVEQDADAVPATITSIGAQEIQEQNPGDLEDLLKGEVGVSVRALPNRASGVFSAVGRGGNEGVNIRGLEGDQVRLQVDGVNLPSTYASGPYAAGRGDMIDPEGYRRVEILRGASSTQYGSDGLAGAVTFVTKEPGDFLTLGKPLQFTLKTGYASVDRSTQLAPSVAFQGQEIQGFLLGSFRRGHETENMGTNNAANVTRTTPNPADTESNYFLGKLQFDPSRHHRFKLTAESIRRRNETDVLSFFGDPFAAATLTDVNVREDIRRDLLKLDYRHTPAAAWYDVLSTSLYVQRALNAQYGYEARSAAPLVRTRDTDYGEDTVGGSVQLESYLGAQSQHRLVYGVDASLTDVHSMKVGFNSSGGAFVPNKSFPDTDYRVLGAFVQDEIRLGAVSVTPGLRYDSFKLTPRPDALYTVNNAAAPSPLSDSELSPKLGAVWRLAPALQLFGQYAHGFRAPRPGQVNGGVTNLTAPNPYTSIGNPSLKAETSNSFETGVRGQLGNGSSSYSVAVFRNRYKDFIASNVLVRENTAPAPDVFQSINLNDVTISGFEARVHWEVARGTSLSAAYAHARGDVKDHGATTPLATIDPDKVVLGARYEPNARWGLEGRLTAAERKKRNPSPTTVTPGGYGVADLAGWYRFSKATLLNVGLGNVFDKKYVEWADVRDLAASSAIVDAFTQPGRHWKVSVTHSF